MKFDEYYIAYRNNYDGTRQDTCADKSNNCVFVKITVQITGRFRLKLNIKASLDT